MKARQPTQPELERQSRNVNKTIIVWDLRQKLERARDGRSNLILSHAEVKYICEQLGFNAA